VSDEIQLTLPAQEDFHHIAHLVVGGLAARHELTFEQLEDIQLAVEALLGCRDDTGEISVRVTVVPGSVSATIGPFPEHALAALAHDDATLGLRRVLETVADDFDVAERDGGAWVQLTKATAD
jgi:anti-sigma regulatory factor (Ser/Thr protein kinase)